MIGLHEWRNCFYEMIGLIGFIPMPDYLMVTSADREMNKLYVNLMYEQVGSYLNLNDM